MGSELVLMIVKALFGSREKKYHIAKKDVDMPRDIASGLLVTSTPLGVNMSGVKASSIPKASSVVSQVKSGTSSQIASNYAKGGSRVRIA